LSLVDTLYRIGHADEAMRLLIDLLRIGAHHGFFQPFIEADTGVHRLLRALEDGVATIEPEAGILVRMLVRRLAVPEKTPAVAARLLNELLSARQRVVLQLIGRGRSNKQIARELNLAPETVKSYVKHIFVKLGTQTRAQSVACAVQRGLL